MASAGFAKCFILFMAVVILVQGAAYLGLAIWGFTQRGCQDTVDIVKDPFKFAMDLIYFAEESCGNPQFNMYSETYTLVMDWSKSFEVTNREFIFMIVYAAVSGLWVVTSLMVITTLCSKTTKLINGIAYWPWYLSIVAGSILDIVATVYHVIDITNTTGLEKTFDYVGAEKPAAMNSLIWEQLESFGAYFTTPAILMTCLSCRVVLIWLLNVFGGTFCISLSSMLAKQNSAAAKSKASASASQAPTRQQTPQPMPVTVVETVTQPAAEPIIQTRYVEEYPEQIRPKPLPIIIPAHNAEMVQRQDSRLYRPSDRTTLQSPVAILPPQVPQQESSAPPLSPVVPQATTDINTYRTTDAHHDQLNYPAAEPVRPHSPAAQQFAVTSPLNNRYSEMFPLQQQPNPRVSEELRNQMPWSYTSMITKPPPPPRKPQQQVQIYPQIPEPDYGDHDH